MASGYEKEHLLGQGGAGAVYRARCRRTGRAVALKVLLEPADEDGVRRFERERRALAEAEHPALVPVLDWGVDEDGCPFLAMPLYEDAQSLSLWIDRLWRPGPPPDLRDRVLPIVVELCGALDHLHDRGVVHRDIKPSNVLVTAANHAILIDLGLALLAGSRLTVDGTRLGTPAYAAPELLRAEPATPATDVYMVGLLVHEMVTGRRASEDQPAFLAALYEGRRGFPPPSEWNRALGPEIDRVLRHATEARPVDRYARAGDLALALEALPPEQWTGDAAPGPPTEKMDAAPRKSKRRVRTLPMERRRFPLLPALVVAALLVLPLVALRLRGPAPAPPRLAVEPGFRALVLRATTADASAAHLTVQPASGPPRELTEPTPVREHRFVVDGLAPGALARFTFRGGAGEELSASAVGPEPPRLLGCTRLAGRSRPTLLVEVTRPVDGELYLTDADGNAASLPLERVAAQHEVAVPPGNWGGAITVRLRARSPLGEVEELPPTTIRLR